jgi:flagellar basal-body rod protein FlgB
MFNVLQNKTLTALEQTLSFAQRRHELLAGNVANLDTPGYRARDLNEGDFQNALRESLDSTAPRDVVRGARPGTRDDRLSGPRHAMEQVVFHDGSDVSLEQQATEMSKNKHLHNLAITTMRSQFSLLRAAITERA